MPFSQKHLIPINDFSQHTCSNFILQIALSGIRETAPNSPLRYIERKCEKEDKPLPVVRETNAKSQMQYKSRKNLESQDGKIFTFKLTFEKKYTDIFRKLKYILHCFTTLQTFSIL